MIQLFKIKGITIVMKAYKINGNYEKNIILRENNFPLYDQSIKDRLMEIKCKIDTLSNKEWEKSKKELNLYEYIYTSSRTNKNICGITPVSRSYFKLYEILKDTIGFKKEGICACIAEGPGGFIHCLNDETNMSIYGITLISKQNQSIPFWNQQIINNKNNTLSYGTDGTGDIYKLENTKQFIDMIRKKGECDLVTADGGFDYSKNYNSQESSSYKLIFSEIYTALHIQKIKGSFIIKIFDMFNYNTIQLIYLLYCCYDNLTIHKPSTSRLSNSEKYIVCEGYNGCSEKILQLMKSFYSQCEKFIINIPDSFLKEINLYNEEFTIKQIETIQNTILNIDNERRNIPNEEQVKHAKDWCNYYNLPLNNNCIFL